MSLETVTLDPSTLAVADVLAAGGDSDRMFGVLRALSLEQFASLFLAPPSTFPHLAAALPPMASEEVQKSWTGTHGERLMENSIEFVRELAAGFARHQNRNLIDLDILDFGCGWGRIMRLMYRYTPPSRLYGVDPWDESLKLCRERALLGNLALSDYVPRKLPFAKKKFDLIYAFSVFTHLSPKTTAIAQATLRRRIASNGLLVISIRSEAYWPGHHYWPEGVTPQTMMDEHRSQGIAYIPHIRPPIDGDITFGDTSISPDFIQRNWKDWTMLQVQPLLRDPMQYLVFLKPRRTLRFLLS